MVYGKYVIFKGKVYGKYTIFTSKTSVMLIIFIGITQEGNIVRLIYSVTKLNTGNLT